MHSTTNQKKTYNELRVFHFAWPAHCTRNFTHERLDLTDHYEQQKDVKIESGIKFDPKTFNLTKEKSINFHQQTQWKGNVKKDANSVCALCFA